MDILDKLEISRALERKNRGYYEDLAKITEKHCPIMFGIKHDYPCSKDNCRTCWTYALMLFAYENYGKDISGQLKV